MKWLAVVNTAAGRAHEAQRAWLQLESACPGIERVLTDGPGSGARIAREAGAYDGLIVIGGDGTVSECLTGMDLPRQRLALLPAGHGLCLARDLGVHTPQAALAALQRPRWIALDLMDVACEARDAAIARRRCASTVAMGYVADVVTTGRVRLPALGHAAYAVAAFLTAPRRFRARTVSPDTCGCEPRTLTGVVVNNTAHLAVFRAFPDARVDDGVLDVMWQDYGWCRQQLHNGAVLAGSAAYGPRALQQASHLRVQLDAPRSLMADGELLDGVTGFEVTCRPSSVQCVAAPS